MALENYRPIQFPEKTEIDNTDVVLIDSSTNGTNKYQLSRITAEAEAKVNAAVAAEATARDAAIAAETTAREQADADLKADLEQLEPLSEGIKAALMNVASHIGLWTDGDGQQYIQDLYDALYAETDIVYIEAVFTQGTTVIYDTTPLNDLKAYLTVTGYYNDGTSKEIRDYSLSGTLTPGSSTITVTKGSKTTTFTVIVTAFWTYEWDYTKGLPNNNGMEFDQNGSSNTVTMTNDGLLVQVENASEKRVRYRYTSLPTNVRYTEGDYELEFKVLTFGLYNQAPYGNGVRMYAGLGDQTSYGTPYCLETTFNTSGTIYLDPNVTNWATLDTTVPFVTDTWYKVRIHQTLTQADVYVDDVLVGSVPVANIKEAVANPQFMANRCSSVLFRAFRFHVAE